jgi:aryl-alcohol dehydrogenase-like predicted oxidoreductase
VGYGCAPASGYDYGPLDETAWTDSVRVSLDLGVTFFDVADVYGFGHAEELLSKALGARRHDVILATKFGLAWDSKGRVTRDSSPKRVALALSESLRRLRVDNIALYQLHWPDLVTPIEDILEGLLSFRDAGKIRFIGVSNIPLDRLQRACRTQPVDSVQFAYNLLCRGVEDGYLDWCKSTNTTVLAHSGLARGLLSGKRQAGSQFNGTDTRKSSSYFSKEGLAEKQKLVQALCEIGQRNGRTASAVALRWVLDRPEVASVIVGMKSSSQLCDNVEAVGWRLAPDEYKLLSSLSAACPGSLESGAARMIANS